MLGKMGVETITISSQSVLLRVSDINSHQFAIEQL